jgi:hypothetical protein
MLQIYKVAKHGNNDEIWLSLDSNQHLLAVCSLTFQLIPAIYQ